MNHRNVTDTTPDRSYVINFAHLYFKNVFLYFLNQFQAKVKTKYCKFFQTLTKHVFELDKKLDNAGLVLFRAYLRQLEVLFFSRHASKLVKHCVNKCYIEVTFESTLLRFFFYVGMSVFESLLQLSYYQNAFYFVTYASERLSV